MSVMCALCITVVIASFNNFLGDVQSYRGCVKNHIVTSVPSCMYMSAIMCCFDCVVPLTVKP